MAVAHTADRPLYQFRRESVRSLLTDFRGQPRVQVIRLLGASEQVTKRTPYAAYGSRSPGLDLTEDHIRSENKFTSSVIISEVGT